MVKIYFNNKVFCEKQCSNYQDLADFVSSKTNLRSHEFYLEQNGKILNPDAGTHIRETGSVHCVLRTLGGKGGFGSMLRAIGAQIEKTTNREACRDLSGRRLRDINEEKRLKAWLEKQSEREREAEERKKRKIEKLLAVPKHEFKDDKYEAARSKLTEKVNDAVEEGFKKVEVEKMEGNIDSKSLKRKGEVSKVVINKKKRSLWIGEDLSGSSSSESSDEDSHEVSPSNLSKAKDIMDLPTTAAIKDTKNADDVAKDDPTSSLTSQCKNQQAECDRSTTI